jgi:DNA-binding transcriptional ArsR family regulator
MHEEVLPELESIFLAFSDRIRLRLVGLMARGEVSVSFLAEQTGESQPKISRHLAYLRDCGVVTTRRDGKWIFYALRSFEDGAIASIIDSTLKALAPSARGSNSQGRSTAESYREGPRTEDTRVGDAQELDVFLL